MDQDYNKSCGCKGCRSCLICEEVQTQRLSRNNDLNLITFYYVASLGKAVCQCEEANTGVKTVVGFNFDGVTILEDFISSDTELTLGKHIDMVPWKSSQSGRRKQDYGPKVNFKKQKVRLSAFTGLPHYIQPVVELFSGVKQLADFEVVEQCNLEYEPSRGSSIDPHFDDDWLWGDRLVTLNLLSDTWLSMTNAGCDLCPVDTIYSGTDGKSPPCFMHLLDQSKLLQSSRCSNLRTENIIVKIPLKQKSLVILHGPARYEWKHSIQRTDIKKRRLCCTFRELSDNFLKSEIGMQLLQIASSFEGEVVV